MDHLSRVTNHLNILIARELECRVRGVYSTGQSWYQDVGLRDTTEAHSDR